ncbi:hypothetical protein ACFYPN_09230 [Streptomyces sp. NPDC005576]|uniref:hypothetical protein n=1 Tax=unclassified Streptomyces TaxID=2593676 RepID=UPI0033D6BBAD
MARFFESSYGSPQAIRRNAITVVAASVFCYVLAAFLVVKGGWDAAYPVLLVTGLADALCIGVWLAFRGRRRRGVE